MKEKNKTAEESIPNMESKKNNIRNTLTSEK